MAFSYCLLETPIPLLNYVAHVRLIPVTDGDHTFWHWEIRFDTPPGREAELERRSARTSTRAASRAVRDSMGLAPEPESQLMARHASRPTTSLGTRPRARSAGSRSARFLGGGTLVMRAVNAGDQAFDTIVRTTRRRRCAGIRAEGDGFEPRRRRHHGRDRRAPRPRLPRTRSPALSAARQCATWRPSAATSSPRTPTATSAVALLALGATRHPRRPVRSGIAIDDFLRDRGRTCRRSSRPSPSRARATPAPSASSRSARVKPKGVSVMSIAALLPQSGGRSRACASPMAAMGPRAARAPSASSARWKASALDAATIERAAARSPPTGIDPPDRRARLRLVSARGRRRAPATPARERR